MKEIILNSLKLCIITLIAGLFLGAVYEITKEPRKKQEEKAKMAAYEKVLKEADEFDEIDFDTKEIEKYLVENGIKKSVAVVEEIVEAKNSKGDKLGYVITVTDKEGYGGEVKIAVGFLEDGTVNGISFLKLEETAGVGMKADQNSFKNQFTGKKVDSFEYTKGKSTSDNQIDAISGATITTNAVTNGVNTAVKAFEYISLENGGDTNE